MTCYDELDPWLRQPALPGMPHFLRSTTVDGGGPGCSHGIDRYGVLFVSMSTSASVRALERSAAPRPSLLCRVPR